MSSDAALPWYSAFDALRQADPAGAAGLAHSFPDFRDEIFGRRAFGPGDEAGEQDAGQRRLALGRASLASIAAATTRSLDEVLGAVRRRALLLARIRFGSGFVSALGGAGVLAFLSDSGGVSGAAISAIIAIVGSLLSLFTGYIEDQSGGAGSVSKLRAAAMDLVGPIAEIRGRIDMGLATRDDQSVAEAMASLNATAAKLHMLRAELGLPLGDVRTPDGRPAAMPPDGRS